MITQINSYDTVSGCTVLDDGVKLYWSGSQIVVAIAPDGTRTMVDPFVPSPLMDALDEACMYAEPRMATFEEECEIATVISNFDGAESTTLPPADTDPQIDLVSGGTRPNPLKLRTFEQFAALDKRDMFDDLVNYRVDRLESKAPEDSADLIEFIRRLALLARRRFQNVDKLRGKVTAEAGRIYAETGQIHANDRRRDSLENQLSY